MSGMAVQRMYPRLVVPDADAAIDFYRAAFGAEELASPRGFLGAGGIFRFSADGLPERGLAVLEIAGRNDVTVVSPPPERFAVSEAEPSGE